MRLLHDLINDSPINTQCSTIRRRRNYATQIHRKIRHFVRAGDAFDQRRWPSRDEHIGFNLGNALACRLR